MRQLGPKEPVGEVCTAGELAALLLQHPGYRVVVTNWGWSDDHYATDCMEIDHDGQRFVFESNA